MNRWIGRWRWMALAGILSIAGCSVPGGQVAGEGAATEPAEPAPAREPAAAGPERASKRVTYVTPGLVTEVDLQRVLEMQDAGKVLLVDVRPPLFYAMGRLPEAISLPKKKYDAEFPEKKPALDEAVAAGKVIVLYCANVDCPDAYTVGKRLSHEGYSVSLYKGGWDEWKATGF